MNQLWHRVIILITVLNITRYFYFIARVVNIWDSLADVDSDICANHSEI